VKKNYCKLFVGLACGALLIPAGAESYVLREYLVVFLGFCALFTILEIALLFIFALEEAAQAGLVWLEAETCVAHFPQPGTVRIPHNDSHGVRR
jgi:hypothetical protein